MSCRALRRTTDCSDPGTPAGSARGRSLRADAANEVGQLTARLHVELDENVAEVSADRAGRDLQCLGDLLVAPAPGYELGDLALATGQGSSSHHRLLRRTHPEVPELVARAAELAFSAHAQKQVMRAA